MKKKGKIKEKLTRVVSEQISFGKKKESGIIKIEAWENSKGEVVKYSMAYINHFIFSGDNGRVIGYDNTHGFHHRHYFGEIEECSDFISYEDMLERFFKKIKEL